MNHCSCGKIAIKGRKICSACKTRAYREKYPIKTAYDIAKFNARRRGHEFTISFEYFKKFAIKSKYIKGKGIYRDSMHMDRIREELGYIPGNIQVLPNHLNVKKYLDYKWSDDEHRMVANVTIDKNEPVLCDVF